MSSRGVFLDRDGVINQYRSNYVRTFEDFAYYDFTGEAFGVLGKLGLPLVVVTNQSGIGRGYSTLETVERIHAQLLSDVREWGAEIGSVQICPHSPKLGACECRKPGPIMFQRAADELKIDFKGSYMVGDAPSDMEAGRRLSMVTLRVETGRGREAGGPDPDYRVADLLAAAHQIAELESELEGPAH